MTKSQNPPPSRRPHQQSQPPAWQRRVLVPLLLVVIAAALGVTAWSWHQSSRPGAVHLRAGQEAEAAHQDAQAEQEWQQGVQEDPRFSDNYAQLGDLYLRQLRFPEAVKEYQAAVKLSPNDPVLYLHLHHALLGAHDPEAALAAIRRASQLQPNDADAAGLTGVLAARMQNRPVALSALRRAHQLKPEDMDYALELARQEMDSLDMAGAERDLTAFLKTHPDNGEANRLMALLYKQKPPTPANIQAALKLANRARQALPESPDVYLLLGQLLLSAEQPKEALQAFQTAHTLNPQAPEILSGLVTCYTRLHDPARAAAAAATLQALTARSDRLEHLKTAVRRNPADNVSRLALARLEEESGDFPSAAGDFVEAVRKSPNDPQARAALSAFYARHKQQILPAPQGTPPH
jgi:cytochrome c-type biogenesis protein CcmH/NrfG